jgi:RsiW-degrading membrane proteinase PrsW (M82 family)
MKALAVLVVSAAPAVAFLVLILRMDRREPEPLRLVLQVIGLGAVSSILAGLAELAMDGVPLFQAGGLAGVLAVSFLQVAPIEEACKLGVVMLFAWGKPAFNEENDGIVYAGASAFGFAVLENILYVMKSGIGTGVLRAFTSIPLHIFTGIVAGLFIGRARFAGTARRGTLLILAGFALAWLFHGLYDAFAMSESALALLLLPVVAGVSAFGIVALKAGRRMSLLRWDGKSDMDRQPPAPAAVAARPRRVHRWMAVVSRILLAGSVLFWVLLAVGISGSSSTRSRGDTILGGVVITFIPLALGVVLEWSYWAQRRNHGKIEADRSG